MGDSGPLGCLYAMGFYTVAVSAISYPLIQVCSLGPFDFARTTYNQLAGDSTALKSKLVDYVRTGIEKEQPELRKQGLLEETLASTLKVNLNITGDLNPAQATYSALWDASEDYAHSIAGQWITPGLD